MHPEIDLSFAMEPRLFVETVESFYASSNAPYLITNQAQRMNEVIEQCIGNKTMSTGILGFPSYVGPAHLDEEIKEIKRYLQAQREKVVNMGLSTNTNRRNFSCKKSYFF